MSTRVLHNAARYYLLSRQAGLIARFNLFRLGIPQLEREHGNAGPRAFGEHVVLGMVLLAVEHLDPEGIHTVDDMRSRLKECAASTRRYPLIATRDGADEDSDWEAWQHLTCRDEFVRYIDALTLEMAERSPQVPYRRCLERVQRQRILARIRKRWPSGTDEWDPFKALEAAAPMVRVESFWLAREVAQEDFREMIVASGHRHFWMLCAGAPEGGDLLAWAPDYEVASDYCWPGISDNTLWLPKNADWLIYQDRFHGTWFAGDWVVRQIKRLWPTWDRHIWATMRYDYPARKPDGFQPMDGGCSHVMDDQPIPVWYRPPDWGQPR